MTNPTVTFIFNLVQDVNIIRPAALLAARRLKVSIQFLVSARFRVRDRDGMWWKEVTKLSAFCNAELGMYDTPYSAFRHLQGRHGAIVSSSESNLAAHIETHDVFAVSPPGFVRVTLQHGYECVGFLQNREHNTAHGRNVRFGADIVGAWSSARRLRSMPASERSKLFVTGPGSVLQQPSRKDQSTARDGLVCENLHSVRLKANGDMRSGFMEVFGQFCRHLDQDGEQLALRPHPGGQYFARNGISPPKNVYLEPSPIYEVDLTSFAYGISAPSSVVLDMVLAGIPTAVWSDPDGVMDVGNYEGLTMISDLDSWLAFRRDAQLRPAMILARQARFLSNLEMPLDPAEVESRFLELLQVASRGVVRREENAL